MSSVTSSSVEHNAVVFTSNASINVERPIPAEQKETGTAASSTTAKPKSNAGPFHRVSEVRQQQGVSLRTAARHLKKDMATVRQQEKETTDLSLSELSEWQRVLEVPLVDLLVDSGSPLSRPVMERARLVRVMKTAASIAEKSESEELDRLSRMLMEQLVEMMPELSEVSPWHSVGQRRSLEEMGRIVERRVKDDLFNSFRDE